MLTSIAMNITPVIKTLQGSSKNGDANLNTFQSLILKALSYVYVVPKRVIK